MSDLEPAVVAAITAKFAPWVRALDFSVEHAGADGARLVLPANDAIVREGGVICGQALMAIADTAMVFALAGALGGYREMTTASLSVSFLRPLAGAALAADARIVRLGRTLVYGEVWLAARDSDKPGAHVTSTYVLLAQG